MEIHRLPSAVAAGCLLCLGALGQIIEFESGGLHYQTQTHNGITVMFAELPLQVRDYAVIEVAISNGSGQTWQLGPELFRFEAATGKTFPGLEARQVVSDFMRRGGRYDVVKLVTAFENGLYRMRQGPSTNGYETRRQWAMAEVQSTKLKAAAAASAIALVPVKLKPGESTDGAIFLNTGGKPLGAGKLFVEMPDTTLEFRVVPKSN